MTDPVTITLPRRLAKHVLVAVVRAAHSAVRRGRDGPNVVRALAEASDIVGDAIGAPRAARFRLPADEAYRWAAVAGSREEYDDWLVDVWPTLKRLADVEPIYVNSVESVLKNIYRGFSFIGTVALRPDFKEIVAAVRSRTFSATGD